MAKNAFKLSTMFGEKFEYCSQRAKNAFKLSTMVGDNFEIYCSQMKNASKLSTMVGEIFEKYCTQMTPRLPGFQEMLGVQDVLVDSFDEGKALTGCGFANIWFMGEGYITIDTPHPNTRTAENLPKPEKITILGNLIFIHFKLQVTLISTPKGWKQKINGRE